jgi:O-antigen ligase
MIRLTALWMAIFALSVYSIRDWFKPACVLILLMPLYGHPDMPSNMAGIQGLNPWNTLFFFVTLAYLAQRDREGSRWDMDGRATVLLVIYCMLMLVSFIRVFMDREALPKLSSGDIIGEYFINAFKWLAPAYFVFVGARTVERRRLVMWTIFLAHLYIALMVIRSIPLGSVTDGAALTRLALKVLPEMFKWSRVNVAMILAGASWATLFALSYLLRERYRYLPLLVFGLMSVALALTGGRTGYATWLILATLFCLARWRKGLILMPLVVASILTLVPSISERMLQGFSSKDGKMVATDVSAVTSGRVVAWPVVLEHIGRSPFIGYGREAMIRTGATQEVVEASMRVEGGDVISEEGGFPHPHNAYLLMLLDSGWFGAIPVFILWALLLVRAIRVCGVANRESDVIGMMALSQILCLLIAGFGSQDLYPTSSTVITFATIGLALRMHTERFSNRLSLGPT